MTFAVADPGHVDEHNRLHSHPAVYATDFGITGVGTADQSANLTTLVASLVAGDVVVMPSGAVHTSTPIVWPDGVRVVGGSSNWIGTGTRVVGTTSGMTVMRCASFVTIENLTVDGGSAAHHGIVFGYGASCRTLNVHVINCTRGGFVLDKAQNGLFVNPTAKNCKWSYYIVNGAQTHTFINATSDGASDVYGADHRSVFGTFVSTDAALSDTESAFTYRNGGVTFLGGILEYGDGLHRVEIDSGMKSWSFLGGAVSTANASGAAFRLDAADVELFVGGGQRLALAGLAGQIDAGTVRVADVSYGGVSGATSPLGLWACDGGSVTFPTSPYQMVDGASGSFSGSVGIWTDMEGTSTAPTYDATRRRMSFTSIDATFGVQWYDQRIGNFRQYQRIRVTVDVPTITGAATIRLQTNLSVSPWRRVLGDLTVGLNEVVFEAQGDEIGFALTASSDVSTTAGVGFFSAEVLGS